MGVAVLINTSRDWGNIVRDRRRTLGMTQKDLGQSIGKTRQWVVRFESGHAGSASVESLLAMLEVLGLGVEVTHVAGTSRGDWLSDVDAGWPGDT